jgi:hypothetical protein
MARGLRVVAIVLVLAGLFLVLAPFRSPGLVGATKERHDVDATSLSCGAPVVDAWHGEQPHGWFGYAPLTSSPPTHAEMADCRRDAGSRLALGLGSLVGAGALVAIATRMKPRPAPA